MLRHDPSNTSTSSGNESGSGSQSFLAAVVNAVHVSPASRSSLWFSPVTNAQVVDENPIDVDSRPEDLEVAVEVHESSDLDAAAEDRAMPLAFHEWRHTEVWSNGGQGGVATSDEDRLQQSSWRMRERMKTVSVALVICLNVGVDPPDVTKTQPCARLECWVDPTTLNPQRAIEAIGNNLQRQYERWQPRARYRQSLDPPLEEVRRLATGLRRNARDERVLFHYNGHGVPKPTANGEIWVFNRNYTQYIPLSLYDLQAWMGSPSIFVYDCSNAGIIVQAFEQFAEQHEREYLDQVNSQGAPPLEAAAPISAKNCIQLAACSANQLLPMNPELPADLFTSCLTTPIKMALRYFVMQNHGKLAPNVILDMLDKIPGQFGDRRTMLGELNWIFTAITDTIAWNTLPRDLFQKLFRQDLLVASLFRNFLLAERVMRSYDCTPVSQPSLPHTHQHGMWKAWDLAVDMALAQLTAILDNGAIYKSSTFFEEQLTAFEVWLRYGDEKRPPPEQLPIVLQVLLSQVHRLRALDLLGRFLDLGPWAVNLALSVGIFPYVLKLLQSSARELRPLLVSIWSKILAVDPSCQTDLIRDASHKYFLSVLQDDCMMAQHRTWAAFILASIVNKYPQGQQEAEQSNMINICLEHLDDQEPVLRQWLAIALGRIWDRYDKARWRGARDNAHERLYELLRDPVPEVRAAAVFALGTFINIVEKRTEHASNLDSAIAMNLIKTVVDDGSSLVRKEVVLALSYLVMAYEAQFVTICRTAMEEAANATRALTPSVSTPALDKLAAGAGMQRSGSSSGLIAMASLSTISIASIHLRVWAVLEQLALDPCPEVSAMVESILQYLRIKAKARDVKTARLRPHMTSTPSTSTPSSPVKPSFLLGSSPTSELTVPPLCSRPASRSGSGEAGGLGGGLGWRQHAPIPEEVALAPAVVGASKTFNGAGDLRMPELNTQFLAWSSKYFSKQLMRHECVDCDCDHESPRHWNKAWLHQRNLSVRGESESQREWLRARLCRLDDHAHAFKVPFQPALVRFHPYNAQVAVAGQRHIQLYDLDTASPLCAIEVREKQYARSRFTALSYVNSHEHALLMAGSDDGFVRVYSDEEEDAGRPEANKRLRPIRLIASWAALSEESNGAGVGRRHGLCMAWQQKTRTVAVGKDYKFVRLWDANQELRISDLLTGVDSHVTCMSFSPVTPMLLVAGFGDGAVRLFDCRTPDGGRLGIIREHVSPVLDCKMQDTGGYSCHLVSGSSDGEVRVTDTRAMAPHGNTVGVVKSVSLGQPVAALSLHDRARIVAAWEAGAGHAVVIHSLASNAPQLNVIKNAEGLLGHRAGPLGCLSFHPHLLQLATAPTDGSVNVYNLKKTV